MEKMKPFRNSPANIEDALEQTEPYKIYDIESLPDDERLAMLDAIEEWKKSENPEFRAGVCVVSMSGKRIARHNESNEPGKGQEGHAEMVALNDMYSSVKPPDRRTKILALAGSFPGEELLRRSEMYDTNMVVHNPKEVDVHTLCGRCRKKLADLNGSGEPSRNSEGEIIEPAWNPVVLMLTGTGQVLRTKSSTLYPGEYVPFQTDTEPWKRKGSSSSTPYNTGK